MNAVLERPVRTTARGLITLPRGAERFPEVLPTGRHFMLADSHYGLCSGEIDRGDVLDVDFDRREFRGDGIYLMSHAAPADEVVGPPGRMPFSSAFSGIRRLSSTGSHLVLLQNDVGGPRWSEVSREMAARFRFCGFVHTVYRDIYMKKGVPQWEPQ